MFSIIVPCYNEEKNLLGLVDRIYNCFGWVGQIDFELILVDDYSKDKTWEKICEFKNKYSWIVGVKHEINKGIVEGWTSGLNVAKGDIVGIMDADLQYHPEDLKHLFDQYLFEKAKENGDIIVQGWRTTRPSLGVRYVLSKGLNFLLNCLFKMRLRDNKSGFLVCDRRVFEKILSLSGGYYYFQNLIMVAANYCGFMIIEKPVDFDKRKKGNSFIKKIPVGFIFRTIKDVIRAKRLLKDVWDIRNL